MRVIVMLHGPVAKPPRTRDSQVDLPPDANAGALLDELGLSDVKGICVVVDGRTVGRSAPLHDGAIVSVFPQAAGG